jgi:hypothetical protein
MCFDGLRQAQRLTPAGGMRGQQRVTLRAAHDCRERAGRLGLAGHYLVFDRARAGLDAVPGQYVCGHELGESRQCPAAHVRHCSRFQERLGEPVRGAHVGVGEPGHTVTHRRYTSRGALLGRARAKPGPRRAALSGRPLATVDRHISGWVSVSPVPPAAASCGLVRLEGRRRRECRCSRGRRPSGCDNEARDRRAAPPQQHRRAVGGRLTRTRLQRACRPQMSWSPPHRSC